MLKSIGTKTQKYIIDENGKKEKIYYLEDVDGKIDVRGYRITITKQATPYLIKIYNLLKDATFSAKNYDSMTYQEKLGLIPALNRTTLHLGNTNIYRAIVGTLEDLGYNRQTSESAFWAGYNAITKYNNTDVSTHFFHIRYVYELIGSGIKYGQKNFGTVKYLIYNDPHGDIWVKSTAEIISELLNSKEIFDDPFRSITISKSSFQ